jgi:hypothetical protein
MLLAPDAGSVGQLLFQEAVRPLIWLLLPPWRLDCGTNHHRYREP